MEAVYLVAIINNGIIQTLTKDIEDSYFSTLINRFGYESEYEAERAIFNYFKSGQHINHDYFTIIKTYNKNQ